MLLICNNNYRNIYPVNKQRNINLFFLFYIKFNYLIKKEFFRIIY